MDQSFGLFLELLRRGDFEFQREFIRAALDNLRYPNLVCFFYCNHLCTIVVDLDDSQLSETILSLLFERLLVEKPHPWGLVYLFLETLKHQKFC